jgi:hypothetical protein
VIERNIKDLSGIVNLLETIKLKSLQIQDYQINKKARRERACCIEEKKAYRVPRSPPTLLTAMPIPHMKPSAPIDNKAIAKAISLIGGLLFTMKVPVGSSLIENA